MATQKPISTISYNSEAFLKEKLDTWYKAHIIQAYMYIKHVGEDGDKDHIHLRIEPNKKLDPMDLQEQLREYVIGQEKPLGCRPFRPSKEEDWILYAVHDPDYLNLKYGGGDAKEKLPYEWTDIVVNEFYDMETAYIRAKATLQHTSQSMATQLRQGKDPMSLIMQGENIYTLNAVIKALQVTDYQRLQNELIDARQKLTDVLNAIEDSNFYLDRDDKNKLVLKPNDDFLPFDS